MSAKREPIVEIKRFYEWTWNPRGAGEGARAPSIRLRRLVVGLDLVSIMSILSSWPNFVGASLRVRPALLPL